MVTSGAPNGRRCSTHCVVSAGREALVIDWLRNRLARKGPAADRKAVLLESGESSGRIEGPKPDGRVTPLTPDDRLRPEKPSPESF